MSIDAITGDQFATLGAAEHALAVYLYQQHINMLERQLKQPFSDNHLKNLHDELIHAQTLRKLHVVALNELLQAPIEKAQVETEAVNAAAA